MFLSVDIDMSSIPRVAAKANLSRGTIQVQQNAIKPVLHRWATDSITAPLYFVYSSMRVVCTTYQASAPRFAHGHYLSKIAKAKHLKKRAVTKSSPFLSLTYYSLRYNYLSICDPPLAGLLPS
jgi:hypothetical protein